MLLFFMILIYKIMALVGYNISFRMIYICINFIIRNRYNVFMFAFSVDEIRFYGFP